MPKTTIRISGPEGDGEVSFEYGDDPFNVDALEFEGDRADYIAGLIFNKKSRWYNPRMVEGPAPMDLFWCHAILTEYGKGHLGAPPFVVEVSGNRPDIETAGEGFVY